MSHQASTFQPWIVACAVHAVPALEHMAFVEQSALMWVFSELLVNLLHVQLLLQVAATMACQSLWPCMIMARNASFSLCCSEKSSSGLGWCLLCGATLENWFYDLDFFLRLGFPGWTRLILHVKHAFNLDLAIALNDAGQASYVACMFGHRSC